ncbi:MAG: hypothetical protein HRT72_13350 [Flavobacteriales bacterium]|nr:hypothetical protein [Flavobacteriales bacterium]
MRSYQRVFLTVVAVFIANVLFAKEYKFDTVPSDPLKTRIYELENGLKVYLSDNKDAPTIQTYIGIASGSKNTVLFFPKFSSLTFCCNFP